MHLNVRVDLATDENELYTRRNERLGEEKERADSSRTDAHARAPVCSHVGEARGEKFEF